MLAVTALCEGAVSCFAILIWLALLTSGVTLDYVLLPTLMLATMVSAVVAPYDLKDKDYAGSPWFRVVWAEGRVISDVFLGYRQLPRFIIARRRDSESD